MTLYDEFLLRYPEFLNPPATEPPTPPAEEEAIHYWLREAEAFLDPAGWGRNFRRACLAWAAAMISSRLRQGQNGPASGEAGPVVSAGVGGESVGYGLNGRFGTGSFGDQWFLLNPPYGPEFLALRDMTFSGVRETRTGLGAERMLHG